MGLAEVPIPHFNGTLRNREELVHREVRSRRSGSHYGSGQGLKSAPGPTLIYTSLYPARQAFDYEGLGRPRCPGLQAAHLCEGFRSAGLQPAGVRPRKAQKSAD